MHSGTVPTMQWIPISQAANQCETWRYRQSEVLRDSLTVISGVLRTSPRALFPASKRLLDDEVYNLNLPINDPLDEG